MMRRFPWFEILMIVVMSIMSLYAAFSDAPNFSLLWFTRDDAYYYFKVAQNISEGRGSTFDGINPTNGYHPLWLLICIPIFVLARFDLILPLRILLLVMNGLCVGTGVLLYRLISKATSPPVGALIALYWVFDRQIYGILYQQGLETGIAAFCIIWLVYSLSSFEQNWRTHSPSLKQTATMALLATAVMFSRLDLVFFAALTGVWIVFRGNPLRYLLPLDILAIVGSGLLAFLLRLGLPFYYSFSDAALTMIIAGLIIKIPIAYLAGLYQRPATWKLLNLGLRVILVAIASSLVIGAVMLVLSSRGNFEGFPRTVVLMDAGFTILFFGLIRAAAYGFRNRTAPVQAIHPIDELHAKWKTWLMEGITFYGVTGGALGLYVLYNKLAFGTGSPVSGLVKRWWGSLPGRVYGGSAKTLFSFFALESEGDLSAWQPVTSILGKWSEGLYQIKVDSDTRYILVLLSLIPVLYVLLLLMRHKSARAGNLLCVIPLLSAAWIQIISYNITGYSAIKEWYWVSQLILIVLLASLVIHIPAHFVMKLRYGQILLWLCVAAVGITVGGRYWRFLQRNMPHGFWPADQAYMVVIPFFESHTEPGSIIGMTGGGNVGYFIHDRTIVNMDGLINSYAYFQALQERRGGDYLAKAGLDYIFANPDIINGQPYVGQFNPYTEWMDKNFGGKYLMRYHSTP